MKLVVLLRIECPVEELVQVEGQMRAELELALVVESRRALIEDLSMKKNESIGERSSAQTTTYTVEQLVQVGIVGKVAPMVQRQLSSYGAC